MFLWLLACLPWFLGQLQFCSTACHPFLLTSNNKDILTKNYIDNLVASNIPSGTTVYFKFFLNAPTQQPAGTYNNTVSFKAVPSGQLP